MDAAVVIAMLKRALAGTEGLPEAISRFQQVMFNEAVECSSAVEEILQDLAYDLDYFEPNPRTRSEDKSLIDEEKALAEIEVALQRIDEVSQ